MTQTCYVDLKYTHYLIGTYFNLQGMIRTLILFVLIVTLISFNYLRRQQDNFDDDLTEAFKID